AEVRDVKDVILDGDRATGAMHLFLPADFAIAVDIPAAIVPDFGGIGILDLLLTRVDIDGLQTPLLERLTLCVDGQRRTDVGTVRLLQRVDAPEMALSFTMFGILPDCDIDHTVVHNGC